MKKFSKIYTLMATALLISAVPVHGMQEIGAMVQTGKEKAIQQFNESVERMQKCFRKRKCTRTEALKVARDLSIAALAAIGIVYGVSKIGRPIQVGDTVSLKKGYGRLRTVISRTPFTATIRSADETEQTVNISNITLEEKGVSIPESPPIPKIKTPIAATTNHLLSMLHIPLHFCCFYSIGLSKAALQKVTEPFFCTLKSRTSQVTQQRTKIPF